nr:MAG TPA: hypothetical protein [Caudoviricetes sp.]
MSKRLSYRLFCQNSSARVYINQLSVLFNRHSLTQTGIIPYRSLNFLKATL